MAARPSAGTGLLRPASDLAGRRCTGSGIRLRLNSHPTAAGKQVRWHVGRVPLTGRLLRIPAPGADPARESRGVWVTVPGAYGGGALGGALDMQGPPDFPPGGFLGGERPAPGSVRAVRRLCR